MNPLLEPFCTPFRSVPFGSIENGHFEPAFVKAIEMAKAQVDGIVDSKDRPSFENTVEALENSGELLGRVSTIFFNLNSAETSPEIQQIAQKVSPMLAQFSSDIKLNEKLFGRVKSVYDSKDKLGLNSEQEMLLENSYKGFLSNGANLSKKDKEILREIDVKLSTLSLKFGENVLAETNDFELHISSEKDLKGLPKGVIDAAKQLAKQRNKQGWVFTLDYPSYVPFITHSDSRALREKMTKAFGSRAFRDNKHNNEATVIEITKLRKQRAELLGYVSHCDFVLEDRMAKSTDVVVTFLQDLLSKAKPYAQKEVQRLQQFARDTGFQGQIQKWDVAYYSEKLKRRLYDVDDEKLKPYFQLEKVVEGVFLVAQKLYGLEFQEIDNVDKYHPEVVTYKVTDQEGNYLALFYADFFPRSGKRDGAWMTSYKGQKKYNAVNERPHVSIVCNFTRPTQDTPSLLTFNEVTTLFHEFGHALHGILANSTYESLSGTNVYWDFVELPSQILENWCYQRQALRLFAKHYQTGKEIPTAYIDKIRESKTFMEASQILRQVGLGMLDIKWHSLGDEVADIKIYEKNALRDTDLYPDIDTNSTSCSFSHIFQGGYSSGYYSYKWAEVLDADAFETFLENGIFDKQTAKSFRENILSKGGTQHPMDLYKAFKGRAPSNKALLRRSGILSQHKKSP